MSLVYYQLCRETGKMIKKFETPGAVKKGTFLKKLPPKKTGRRKITTYVGVSFDARSLSWRSYITIDGKAHDLGYYPSDREAAIARDKVAIQHGRKTNILTPARA